MLFVFRAKEAEIMEGVKRAEKLRVDQVRLLLVESSPSLEITDTLRPCLFRSEPRGWIGWTSPSGNWEKYQRTYTTMRLPRQTCLTRLTPTCSIVALNFTVVLSYFYLCQVLADFSRNMLEEFPSKDFFYWMTETRKLKVSQNRLKRMPEEIAVMVCRPFLFVAFLCKHVFAW